MERTDVDVEAYLSGLTGDNADAMRALDEVIAPIMSGLPRSLWEGVFWGGTTQSIVGYGDLRQPRPGGDPVDWFLLGLARQKRYVSLYVNAVENGEYLGKRYADSIGASKVGASSLSFARLEDVDLDELRALVTSARRSAGAA